MNHIDRWRIKNEAKLRILRSEKKRTGNELPDNQVVAGGDLKTGPKQFKGQLEGFKGKLTGKDPQPEGLGDKGMEAVGKSTFANPVDAGETPTVSKGIPVGEPKGQFEAYKTWKEFAPVDPGVGETGAPPLEDPADPMGAPAAGDPAAEEQPVANEENPFGLPSEVNRPLNMAFKNAMRKGPEQYRKFVMAVNSMLKTGVGDKLSAGMGRTLGMQTSRDWRAPAPAAAPPTGM